VAAVAVGALLVAGGAAVGLALSGNEPATSPIPAASTTPTATQRPVTPTPTPKPTSTPKPTDFLTGGKVSGNEVIAVKVENIAAARPQVGLRFADIVFAEEVEGGQTRLIAVYHTRFPSRLGPVRSARSTDVQLLPLFGKPGLVYSGANSNVQGKIDRASIVPIERSTRDRSRIAPHNVFVDLDRIAGSVRTGKATDIGWNFAADDPRWDSAARSTDPRGKVGNDTFGFNYTGGRYVVKWRGQPYQDGVSGRLTTADNVVMMSVHNHGDGNRDVVGSPSVMSDTVGKGKVTIYRDGRKRGGTWTRKSTSGDLTFTDAAGNDIALKPGKTWVLLRG
jgi:hypothetical protein